MQRLSLEFPLHCPWSHVSLLTWSAPCPGVKWSLLQRVLRSTACAWTTLPNKKNKLKGTEMNRIWQKQTETDRNGQKGTERDRNQQKPTETNRNQQKQTETETNGQKKREIIFFFFMYRVLLVTCLELGVMCHVLCVMWHVLCVMYHMCHMCHMAPVTNANSQNHRPSLC